MKYIVDLGYYLNQVSNIEAAAFLIKNGEDIEKNLEVITDMCHWLNGVCGIEADAEDLLKVVD